MQGKAKPTTQRGKLCALSAGVLGGLLILVSLALLKERLIEWWYRIPEVRTWADLLAGTPLRLDQGGRAWIGIEAKRCPQWSGVLLYCLVEGYRQEEGVSESPLGPLHVSLGLEERSAVGGLQHVWSSGLVNGDSKVLFVRTLPATRLGENKVRLLSLKGKLVGQATVEGTPPASPPWMPLGESRNAPDGRTSLGIDAGKKAIALPSWDGSRPYPLPKGKSGLAEPLPRLFPPPDQERLRLGIEGESLRVTCDEEIVSNATSRYFLARWWVNGVPYVPEQVNIHYAEDFGGSERLAKQLIFALDFDPSLLQARKGDRIEMQLLYSGTGWDFAASFLGLVLPISEDVRVLLSNRVSFVAP